MRYKETIVYELHVRSFADGDGDCAGLLNRFDYLERLGLGALWLQPFTPRHFATTATTSPTTAASARPTAACPTSGVSRAKPGIAELVLTHTSDRHSWFQRARQAKPGSPAQDFSVWSDTPEKYRQARSIFKDFQNSKRAFDPVAEPCFWRSFDARQPDRNHDNPAVRQALLKVVDCWHAMGVDGLRLDAVPPAAEAGDEAVLGSLRELT